MVSFFAIRGCTPILEISIEPLTSEEGRALEALKVAGAQELELEWWEVRDLVAERAAKGYTLKLESHEVIVPLLFPIQGPLGALSPFFKGYIHFVKASINGRELLLMLDTGAFTTLSPKSAVKHKLPISIELRSKREIKYPAFPAFLTEGGIKVGQAEVIGAQIIISQSNVRAKLLGIPIWHFTGVLGSDFLGQFSSVTIDYPNRVLVLRHPDLVYEPKGGALRMPLRVFKFRPIVEVYLDGKGPFPFLFDTGASSRSLLVAPEIALELGFVGHVPTIPLEHVKIGELELKDIKAKVILLPKGQEFLGIMPRPLFSSYRVTIDFKKQLIFLEQP